MGRYYSGDINGKFWFAVQSSDDPSFFGGTEIEPQYIEYSFDADDAGTIEDGILKCVEALDGYKAKIDGYLAAHDGGYNDDELAHALGVPRDRALELIGWYARLELGEKIRACVKEKGACSFDAEF